MLNKNTIKFHGKKYLIVQSIYPIKKIRQKITIHILYLSLSLKAVRGRSETVHDRKKMA